MPEPDRPDPATAAVAMLRDIADAVRAVAVRLLGLPDEEDPR